ncbi:glucose-1-phosphate thymidylyltransferase [Paenibacillus baekrokdamisoli]|uniref:Glucose-1-phosphate thymidylyltransferase n=1 Tax=Paenibacillus baekrokdamisoli TaxID=1712516 RepID=A0A3G9IRU5_9BACL|nr:sugar phosphate nucleotidyltransferase [Paenibacillus baekrokdamisoli]MBB3069345.1 glucose-1-phosphate thymidylyltransferase [Paenibacillus baekrokdamisoli]BBH18685.1 glucose-1-phosphate thymidylyltransferase [Paenibacillus baekrokdamisoli]
MKAVILAGGTGTRLLPLTRLLNKHLLPVGKLPMICYSLQSLNEAGISDILLVTGRQAAGSFIQFLGSGYEYGVSLTYRIQEEAGGIAQALELAKPFVGNDQKFVVLLGDNLFEESLKPHIDAFEQQPEGAMVLLKQVPDPERYGVPVFDANGYIERIDEKPAHPQTNYCVTGIYMYDTSVFTYITEQAPSNRGELEITDVNNAYAGKRKLAFSHLQGWWTDAGTFDSLLEAAVKLMGAAP